MVLVQYVLIRCLMPDNHTDFVLKVNFECLLWKSLLFLLLYITFSERQRKVKIGSLNTSSFPSNRIVRFLSFFFIVAYFVLPEMFKLSNFSITRVPFQSWRCVFQFQVRHQKMLLLTQICKWTTPFFAFLQHTHDIQNFNYLPFFLIFDQSIHSTFTSTLWSTSQFERFCLLLSALRLTYLSNTILGFLNFTLSIKSFGHSSHFI